MGAVTSTIIGATDRIPGTTAPTATTRRRGVVTWKPPGIKKHIQPHVIALLERAAAAGFSIVVTGGRRDPEHNRAVGGAPGSMHLTGAAVDITSVNGKGVNAKNADAIALTKWFRANGAAEAFGPSLGAGGADHEDHVHLGVNADGSKSGGGSGDSRGDASRGTGVGDTLPPDASDADVQKWIISNYPDMDQWLSIPEIKNILFKAARNEWDANRVMSAVRGTTWWKSNPEKERAWQLRLKEDPATAKKDVEQTALNLRLMARDRFRLNISDDIAKRWATSLERGKYTEERYEEFLRQQAAGKYTQFADQILGGADPVMLLDLYRQEASEVFERAVGFDDIVMRDVGTVPMTLSEYRVKLRQNPEWKTTKNYREEDANTALFLEQQMGLRA